MTFFDLLIGLGVGKLFRAWIQKRRFSERGKRAGGRWGYASALGIFLGNRLRNDPYWFQLIFNFVLWIVFGIGIALMVAWLVSRRD